MVQKKSYKTTLLKVLLGASFIIFSWSLFGNLQYPLLWNDEAECAMHSQRVLASGFPKVHDGKNVVYPLRLEDKSFAIDGSDNYIGIGWGMFYYGALATKTAQYSDDVYLKTWLLRMPFALLGLLGVSIFCLAFAKLFESLDLRLIFSMMFFLLLTLHVDIALHLREMRYYSLVVFLSAVLIHLTFHHRSSNLFKIALPILTVLLYLSFPPAALILLLTIVSFLLYVSIRRIEVLTLGTSASVLMSFIGIIPLFIYFKTWDFSSLSSEFYQFDIRVYLVHLRELALYFLKFSFFGELIMVAVTLLFVQKIKWLKKVDKRVYFSIFLSVVYLVVTAKIPHFVFTRYYIPVMIIQCAVFAYFIIQLFEFRKSLFAVVFALGIMVFMVKQYGALSGRAYELTHQYKGPLDYQIPFILENYDRTDTLVIATNYEECSYMYYLGSKVTMGFVLNNLEEDLKSKPDIIIFRHDWAWNYERSVFDPLFEMGNYEKKEFEVYDNPYNNITELNLVDGGHLFKTKLSKRGEEKASLFLLK